MTPRDPRRGVVLALVLILVLLLSSAVITFQRRALVDVFITRNRDAVAQAETLARGGVQLAMAVLLQDLILDHQGGGGAPLDDDDSGSGGTDTLDDLWAQIGQTELTTRDGATLRLRIEDAGARLNLNSFVDYAAEEDSEPDSDAEEFLVEFFTKVIDEVPLAPGEKVWDPRELAQNLLDYVDPDEGRIRGGAENDYYSRLTPPYAAANRPLLSVDELRMVEGFDVTLAESLRPYVTVYPLVAAGLGVNLNTAPPHVLASVSHGTGGNRRLLDEERVRWILRAREDGKIVCDETAVDPDRCVTPASLNLEGGLYPPSRLPAAASVFQVTAIATVSEVRRSAVAILDRSDPTAPRLLSFRFE